MTYKEYLDDPYQDAAKKSEAYQKANQELIENSNGFFDKSYWDNYIRTKAVWQDAMNNLSGTLLFIRKQNIDLNWKITTRADYEK